MNICIGLYNAFCAKKLNITDILLELAIKRIRKVNLMQDIFGKVLILRGLIELNYWKCYIIVSNFILKLYKISKTFMLNIRRQFYSR